MIRTVITAIISFASTNIDDIFVLMLFFTQINNGMKIYHVIIGQYLGILALTAISIIGALGVSVIPHEYIGLLGLVPIYLGIKAYVDHRNENKDDIDQQETQNIKKHPLEQAMNHQRNPVITFIRGFTNLGVIKVASVTFSNGGDNMGIYIPLFVNMDFLNILVTVITFLLLIALWCFIGFKLAEHPFIQRILDKYKHIFVPMIFIGLGLFILMENKSIIFIYKRMFS